MGLNDQQRRKIQSYVDHSDRGVEPVFVGREDLFQTVASAARACADQQPHGQTVCLAGPPGIGKTAFLRALRTRSLTNGWNGPPILFVDLDASELHNPQILLVRINEALPEDWRGGIGKRLRGMLEELSERGVSVSLPGVAVGVGNVKRPPLFPWKVLEDILAVGPDGCVLCVCVDEAHALKPTPGEERNEALAQFHRGNPKVPAFVLLAGHSQTPDVIEPSVSRRLASRPLKYVQGLSAGESRRYVEGILDHCGIQASCDERRPFVAWVTTGCDGFPQHLRGAMTALGEEVLHVGSVRLRDLDVGRIAGNAADLQIDYYQGRLAGLDAALPVAQALFRRWGDEGVPRFQAKIDANKSLSAQDADQKRLLREAGLDSAQALFDRMVSRGLLAANRHGDRWGCPIPSLRQYVLTGTFKMPPPRDQSPPKGVRG